MSVRVTNRIWETSKMKGGPLVLLLAIADNADDEGFAWPGIAYLAAKCRMTERQVYNNISTCIQANELRVMPGGGHKTNRYYILCTKLKLAKWTPEKISGVKPTSGVKPISGQPCNPLQGTPEAHFRAALKPTSGEPSLTVKETVKETVRGERPIRKGVKKLGDLVINDYFEWLVYEHAPHVRLEHALVEFVNYCQAMEPKIKDFAAAFENSILRREQWWRDKNPPEKVSPARRAHRAAFRDWIDGGEKGEAPDWQAFEHLNQRGPDV